MEIINFIRYQAVAAAIIVVGLAAIACTGAAHAAGLLIADGGFGGVLKIQEQHADVTINNGIAVTEITQVFRNTEDRQLEALYTFPVPNGASLSNFSMWINGKEMVGEVVEKKRAREIYNSYKQKRQDPGLLEQTDYKTFEMRIFPIGPRAEQKVQITYYQELEYDHDWATYVYPLATVARKAIDQQVEGAFGIDFKIRSEVPIADLKSPSHPDEFVYVNHDPTFREASLEVTAGSLAKDVVLACHFERPTTGADLVTSRAPAGSVADAQLSAGTTPEDGYFQFTITAGKELEDTAPAMNYLFLIDISGSMAQELKLATSAEAASAFVGTLGKEERFEVMGFNTAPVPLFNDLEFADETTLQAARDFVTSQKAAGGTRLDPALQVAFRYAEKDPDRTLNIVLFSDGMTEQATRQTLLNLVAQAPKNIRLFCVGIGNEVDRLLLQQVANDAGGLAAFISHGDDFKRQAEAFRRKLMRPAISDVSVDFQGGQVYDIVPQKLPNLYHGQPIRVYGRYRGNGGVNAVVRGNLSGNVFEQPLQLEFPENDAGSPEIERMWAWHKIQELDKAGETAGTPGVAAAEIVRLGEAYSIATQYTSFLVLENNEEFQRWQIQRRNALRTSRDRAAQAAVREQLERMRNAALNNVGPDAKPSPEAKPQQLAQAQPVPTQQPQAQPFAGNPNGATPEAPARREERTPSFTRMPQPERRGFDFPSMPRGGGAIDPISGAMVFGLAALTALAKRRKRG